MLRPFSPCFTAEALKGIRHNPDTEPDNLWKQNLKAQIQVNLNFMVQDAQLQLELDLKKQPADSARLHEEFAAAMDNIEILATETFKEELERERYARRWATSQVLPPELAETMKKEQRAILDRIQRETSSNIESTESIERPIINTTAVNRLVRYHVISNPHQLPTSHLQSPSYPRSSPAVQASISPKVNVFSPPRLSKATPRTTLPEPDPSSEEDTDEESDADVVRLRYQPIAPPQKSCDDDFAVGRSSWEPGSLNLNRGPSPCSSGTSPKPMPEGYRAPSPPRSIQGHLSSSHPIEPPFNGDSVESPHPSPKEDSETTTDSESDDEPDNVYKTDSSSDTINSSLAKSRSLSNDTCPYANSNSGSKHAQSNSKVEGPTAVTQQPPIETTEKGKQMREAAEAVVAEELRKNEAVGWAFEEEAKREIAQAEEARQKKEEEEARQREEEKARREAEAKAAREAKAQKKKEDEARRRNEVSRQREEKRKEEEKQREEEAKEAVRKKEEEEMRRRLFEEEAQIEKAREDARREEAGREEAELRWREDETRKREDAQEENQCRGREKAAQEEKDFQEQDKIERVEQLRQEEAIAEEIMCQNRKERERLESETLWRELQKRKAEEATPYRQEQETEGKQAEIEAKRRVQEKEQDEEWKRVEMEKLAQQEEFRRREEEIRSRKHQESSPAWESWTLPGSDFVSCGTNQQSQSLIPPSNAVTNNGRDTPQYSNTTLASSSIISTKPPTPSLSSTRSSGLSTASSYASSRTSRNSIPTPNSRSTTRSPFYRAPLTQERWERRREELYRAQQERFQQQKKRLEHEYAAESSQVKSDNNDTMVSKMTPENKIADKEHGQYKDEAGKVLRVEGQAVTSQHNELACDQNLEQAKAEAKCWEENKPKKEEEERQDMEMQKVVWESVMTHCKDEQRRLENEKAELHLHMAEIREQKKSLRLAEEELKRREIAAQEHARILKREKLEAAREELVKAVSRKEEQAMLEQRKQRRQKVEQIGKCRICVTKVPA